ncbi:MAG: hypothetical protein WHU94_12970 [Thermogemmata sp.]
MLYQGIRKRQTLSCPIMHLYRLSNRTGLFLTEDKTIYEFEASGTIRPLAEKPELATPAFQEVLRPRGKLSDSRRLAVAKDGSRLFIADGQWSRSDGKYGSNFLEVCLLDLSGGEPPLTHRIPETSSSPLSNDPFFFLEDERIGVPLGGLCVNLNAHDLTPYPPFNFTDEDTDPPIIIGCLSPHPSGREFSIGLGEVGRGVYRRLAITPRGEHLTADLLDEVLFAEKADLWATMASPSGSYAFVFLLRHEMGMVLPHGRTEDVMADLGKVVRIRDGRTESLTVRGQLGIDFIIQSAPVLPPKPELYQICPKGPHTGSWYPALCPVNDDLILYSTPGGTLLEVDFAHRQVRELVRVGFSVRVIQLLSPFGPLAVAGEEGQFWLLDVEL